VRSELPLRLQRAHNTSSLHRSPPRYAWAEITATAEAPGSAAAESCEGATVAKASAAEAAAASPAKPEMVELAVTTSVQWPAWMALTAGKREAEAEAEVGVFQAIVRDMEARAKGAADAEAADGAAVARALRRAAPRIPAVALPLASSPVQMARRGVPSDEASDASSQQPHTAPLPRALPPRPPSHNVVAWRRGTGGCRDSGDGGRARSSRGRGGSG
jgi:hypothetical protein